MLFYREFLLKWVLRFKSDNAPCYLNLISPPCRKKKRRGGGGRAVVYNFPQFSLSGTRISPFFWRLGRRGGIPQ